MPLSIFTTALVALLFFLLFSLIFRKHSLKLPPTLPWIPVAGSVPWLGAGFKGEPIATCEHLRKKYGNIFGMWIWGKYVVVANDYDSVREILLSEDFADRVRDDPRVLAYNPKYLGIVDGLYTREWKKMRTFCLTNLKKLGFGTTCLESKIKEEARTLLSLVKQRNGSSFNIYPLLYSSAASVISCLLFGRRYKNEDKSFQELLQVCDKFSAAFIHVPQTFGIKWLEWTEFETNRQALDRLQDCERKVQEFCFEHIENHRKTLDSENLRDFVDAYLLQNNNKSNQNREAFAQVLLDLFLAGSGTTATTLYWSILFMANYPNIQTKVQSEIDSIVAKECLPSLTNQKQMPYTNAVLLEIQRRGSVGPFALEHVTTVDTNLMGYQIPKCSSVFVNLHAVHHDTELWDEPNVFKPDRFLNDKGELVHNEHLIPFGLGPRECLGEQLAKHEIFIFFTSLFQTFRFEHQPEIKCLPEKGILHVVHSPQPYQICAKVRTEE